MAHQLIMGHSGILSALCQNHKQWGMFVAIRGYDENARELKAAPWLTSQDLDNMAWITDGEAYVMFDSEMEMQEAYAKTIGEETSRKQDLSTWVYALTCDSEGHILSENTCELVKWS